MCENNMEQQQERYERERRKRRPQGNLGYMRYRCIICRGVFVSDRPEAEAIKEARERYGPQIQPRDLGTLCPDCWRSWERMNGGVA